jgi:hypothetical protein
VEAIKKDGIKGDKTSLQRMEADGVLLISVRQLASGYPFLTVFFSSVDGGQPA